MLPTIQSAGLAAWLVLAAGPAPQLSRPAEVRSQETDALRDRLVEALRTSRKPDGPDHEEVVATIRNLGSSAVGPMLEILVQRRIPGLREGDEVQILSQPQRDMLLAGFALWSPGTTIASIEARLAVASGPNERLAGIYVHAAVGQGTHLERVLELALASDQVTLPPERLPKEFEKAVRLAFARILGREAGAFRSLRTILERAPACFHRPIVFALGDTRDACAIEPLALVLAFHDDLAPLIIGQVRLLGRSSDEAVNRALSSEVRGYLDSERVELACAAARSLGELGDDECVPRLVEMLESPIPPVVDSAHWALRRLSGLQLPPLPGPWRRSRPEAPRPRCPSAG